MALLSRTLALGSLILADSLTSAAFLSFPVHDSNDRPMDGFRDGLPTYVRLTKDWGEAEATEGKLEQFLLCTSCTISYIFGKVDSMAFGTQTTEQMRFKAGSDMIPVTFIDTNLQLYEDDDETKGVNFNMQVGYIDPQYQSSMYFDQFQENMLGLAPMLTATNDPVILQRQFLYQFTQTGDNEGKGFAESYAFNGGSAILVGGSRDDYEAEICDGTMSDQGFNFENKGLKKENAMVEGSTSMNFADAMYYKGADLMLKISNYLPPMKEELADTVLALDTWNRELQLPLYFYEFFMETFMVPAYTCDKLTDSSFNYPGLKSTYACYCNNGDYHTMPAMNFEIRGKDFQYDLDPSGYMFLPYLNYTQPMSLCVLGVQPTEMTSLKGTEYVALGQRQLATFPFYTVFDRETNTAMIELGGAVARGMDGSNGTAKVIAIGIVVVLAVMLVYLIALRAMRIKAEEWLKANKHVLFSHAANLQSEHDILKKLVNGSATGPKLNGIANLDTHHPPAKSVSGNNNQQEVTENLLDMDNQSQGTAGSGYRANSMGSNGRKVAPPNPKQFKEAFE